MTFRLRTGYSFRNAVGRVDDAIAAVKAAGWPWAPITDTASTFGYVRWMKACAKAELRPVFGVEIAVSPSVNAKKPVTDGWTFIAIDNLQPIHELIALATEQFRYTPVISIEQALAAVQRGGLICMMGHRSPVDEIAPIPNLYFPLGPSTTRGYADRCVAAGHKPMATSDNRYITEDQEALYEVVCGRNASTQAYPQWVLNDDDWRASVDWATFNLVGEALANRDAAMKASVATITKAKMVQPPRPDTLRGMCESGAARLGCDLTRPEYAARLTRELDLIRDKGFEDYFYLVSDICSWSRDRMIVGPARGSSCGSLVCYLLRITSIDPIPYGLIFERFIDVNRADLPDIDIDFPEDRRNEVFEYIAATYGRERVARLGTVAMYQPKSALKETAAAMDIPPWLLNPVLDAIIDRSSGDSRALQATEDTLKDTAPGRAFLHDYPEILIATGMEGHPRHYSQHAAGIVITDRPVNEVVAVDQRTGATMCDKKDAEALDLLKVDALGLTQLSIFEEALKLAGLPYDHLFGVPLDDPAAFQVLNDHRYAGIFQFNGLALQSITDQIHVTELNDLVSITALARPGPLNTGGTNHWIKVKTGKAKETYPHPIFEPYLRETRGVVTYQEQVMVIGREVGGLGWGDVTSLRKTMSNRAGAEAFNVFGDRWKAGAIERGVPADVAQRVWDDLCAYGSWAFNKSHALAYGVVSYYCCWLKAHYPVEFAAATLTYTTDPDRQIKLLRELASEGIDYVPADLHLSTDKWAVGMLDGKKRLIGPLSNVLGIGPKMMSQIISARHRQEPISDSAAKKLTNPKTKIDSLFPISERFKALMPDPAARNIFSVPKRVIDVQVNGTEQEVLVFCTLENIKPKDENEEVNVAKRGGRRFTGPTAALNLRLADDTDVVFAKVDRFKYNNIGLPMVERGRAGKALYAIKGIIPKDFRMIRVTAARYIGDLELEAEEGK
jgi:DNA polymerase III alpha subunit